MRAKELQAAKIRQIADALIAGGYISLNEQARVLGLSRSTTWNIIRGTHKKSGLSGAVINRMLAQPRLPQAARARILEYVEDKSAGIFGHTPSQVWRFLEALSPFRPATNPDAGFFDTEASIEDHISVRDWRHKPPLQLRVTKKLHIHWCWIKCTRCPYMRAVAIAPYMIRWGPDGWRDMLRRAARCTNCGTRGVELQHPSWGGSDAGWAPMPVAQIAPVPPLDRD